MKSNEQTLTLANFRKNSQQKIRQARDYYHDIVCHALPKDGWKITHDPIRIKLARRKNLFVDLEAQKLIAAEKGMAKIAVEIKEEERPRAVVRR